MTFRVVSVTRSYEQVVEQIQDGIRRGTLVPGQRLPTERDLGETFGVSRAVVREALKVLSAMGLVESRQGSGTFVRSNPVPSIRRALTLSATPEEASIFALFEVREGLEALAARYAAERRTPEQADRILAFASGTQTAAETGDKTHFSLDDTALHRTIWEAAANPYLTGILGAVRELLQEAIHLIVALPGSILVASGHHLATADAIERGDGIEAARSMAEHIRYSADALQRNLIEGGIAPPGPIGVVRR